MSEEQPKIPKPWVKGLTPTLNNTGCMFDMQDEFAAAFIKAAGESADEALEVGCAYGVATIPALEAGATITACDLDEGHLKILRSRTPEELHKNLTTVQGRLPDIDLPENHFGTILCSRVLHFLSGDDVQASVNNMFKWMKPGGKLFLVADTPYGIWRRFIPTWEENMANDAEWPGFMKPTVTYLPTPSKDPSKGPPFMNLMSPQILCRTARRAGFDVRKCAYIDQPDFIGDGRMDGRENCGIMAVKPDPNLSYDL